MRNRVATVLLAASAAFVPSAAADQPGRTCEVIGFSPRFDADQTAYCVLNEYVDNSPFPTGNLIVRKSVDGGATWGKLPAVGLQGLGVAFPSQLIVSPEYPDDDTIYVQVVYGNSPGIYRSTDGGRTFVNVGRLASTGFSTRALTAFLMPDEVAPPPLGDGREAFAYATKFEGTPALIAPPVHEPVVGAPGSDEAFVLSATFPRSAGYAVSGVDASSGNPAAPQPLYSVYRCDATLSCLEKIYDFPVGWSLQDARMLREGAGYFVMAPKSNDKILKVWRMDETGSIEEWSTLNNHLPNLSRARAFFPRVSVAENPESGLLYARFSYVLMSHDRGAPTDQIFTSRDGGITWQRASSGRGVTQPGRVKGIPWQVRAGPPHAEGDIYAPSGDRLMVIAERVSGNGTSFIGVFCSFDEGSTWAEACVRRS